MVKKQTEEKKKDKKKEEEKEKEKKEDEEENEEEETKTKRKHRVAGKSKFKVPIKRLCKSLSINQVNKDAFHILDSAIQRFITGLLRHTASMLSHSNKTFTQQTARLAFMSYMQNLGAPDDITKGALKRADAALKHLNESFGTTVATKEKATTTKKSTKKTEAKAKK